MSVDLEARQKRVDQANELLLSIASTGRRFFHHQGRVCRLELCERGRVWFVDSYTQKRVFTHYNWGRWRGFTGGGTLRDVVTRLRDFIMREKRLPAGVFGPWPSWVCGGDRWGYGEDMEQVRAKARELGIVERGEGA